MRTKATILVLLLVAFFSVSLAIAQDPAKVEPNKYKVLFENERVRVLEYRDKPGDKTVMHVHPDYLVYVFAPFKRKFTSADGTSQVAEGKAGQVMWRPAETHSGENIGTTDTHVLIIELKQ
jgi:quercetin dioxygenase-like cupin family protein